MSATEALIVSLQKPAEDKPWRAVMLIQGELLTATSIGAGGQTPAGPRLLEAIKHLEEHIKGYPFEYGMTMVADGTNRLLAVRYIGKDIGMMEATKKTLQYIKKSKVTPRNFKIDENVMFSETFNAQDFMETEEAPMMMMAVAETPTTGETPTDSTPKEMEENIGSPDQFLLYGEVTKVIDGDTATIKTLAMHKSLKGKNIGKYLMDVGVEFNLRFIGIDSPETRKKGNAAIYADKQNSAIAALWGVTTDVVYDVGEEAKHTTAAMIAPGTDNAYVLVALQYDRIKNVPLHDNGDGQRPLGMLYHVKPSKKDKDKYKTTKDGLIINVDDFLKAMSEDNVKGTNINKTLLGKRYSKDPRLPLYQHDTYNNNKSTDQGIDVITWGDEVGYKEPSDSYYNEKDPKSTTTDDISEQESIDKAEKLYENKYKEPVSNALDFVLPYDDRLADENGIYSRSIKLSKDEDALEEPYNYVYKVRIGDVLLTVPPLSIQMSRISQIERVKTLRTQTSMMKGVGSAKTTIELELYFHGMDAINGKEWGSYEMDGKTYPFYMDGLRTLIAQFKKAPFLPIDNKYINESLNIHNVALMNLTVQTVPDFPQSLKAVLTLSKFEPEAFMIEEPSLSNVMNYPLFRWYYQQALRKPEDYEIPNRMYLEKINELTNEFHFFIADEGKLKYRMDAINELFRMVRPEEYEKQVKEKTSDSGQLIEDENRVKKVLKQYDIYDGYREEDKKKFKIGPESKDAWGREAYQEMYEGSMPVFKGSGANSSFVSKSYVFYQYFLDNYFLDNPKFKEYWEKVEGAKMPGFFIIAFNNQENVKKIDARAALMIEGKQKKRSDGSVYFVIPATKENIKILESMKGARDMVEGDVQTYSEKYTQLQDIVDSTEQSIAMVPYDIPGLIPTSINVMYENQFSSMQMQMLDSPTLQYMGGQDPYIQLIFEGDQNTVMAMNEMLLVIERYNRQYRQGIVAGFMDVTNPLLKMFGVKTLMPENVQINTVPGFPDRFQIVMALCGFDRTQRRQERLDGISGAYDDTRLQDRRVNNYSEEKDYAIMEYRMRGMEVYPDLELPTFEELNKVLPSLKAGFDTYENRSDQIYVDPDFYIGSQKTLRDMIAQVVKKDSEFKVVAYDNRGLKTTSKLNGVGFIDPAESKTFVDAFNSLDKAVDYVPSDFTWQNEKEKDATTNAKSEEDALDSVALEGDIKDYVTIGEDGKAPYQKLPGYENWKKFSGNKGKSKEEYEKWKKNPDKNPREEVVWFAIMQKMIEKIGRKYLEGMDDDFKMIANGLEGKHKLPSDMTNEDWSDRYRKSNWYNVGDMITKMTDGNYGATTFMPDDIYGKSMYLYYKGLAEEEDEYEKWKKIPKSDLSYIKSSAEFKASPTWAYNGKRTSWGNISKNLFNNYYDGSIVPYDDDPLKGVVKIPLHRMGGIIKSIAKYHSRWTPFEGDGSGKLTDGWRAGLMGYPLDIVKDKAEAERLMYDWKYNLEKSMDLLAKYYKHAFSQKELRYKAFASEWMVWQYGLPNQDREDDLLPIGKKSDASEVLMPNALKPAMGYRNVIMREWRTTYAAVDKEAPAGIFAGGKGPVVPAVFAMYNGFEGNTMDVFTGDKDAIIKSLINDLYYPMDAYKVDDDKTKIVAAYKKEKMSSIKAEARAKLEKKSRNEVDLIFYNHLSQLKNIIGKGDNAKKFTESIFASILTGIGAVLLAWFGTITYGLGFLAAGALGIGAGMLGDSDSDRIANMAPKAKEIMDAYNQMDGANETLQNNRLVNRNTPQENHFNMYKDMLEYDMQGRMVRAFPTFQMFIVDEGKWMANYRIWDNLYGFNAIQSIDIYRSRKIAADTASISMTNMYSNLNGRRTDMMNARVQTPAFWSTITWSQYILGKPPEELIETRKELYKAMYLQTGARIHLRMGYGSNVTRLPIVFNGTITEMDTGEVVNLLCQGDGIELSNMISGDPGDDNSFLRVQEPAESIGRLLTSKGGAFKDLINNATDGQFFKDNPLGVMHFGAPVEAPMGNYVPFNRDFGEAAQNIYCANGVATFDQWKNEKGEDVNFMSVLQDFDTYGKVGITDFLQPGDEPNIRVKYFNNTIWDIIQTFALCSSDYIAAVLPFEMRSTLFFGKPHWNVAYRYDSTYAYDETIKEWTRTYDLEHRKPYMQMHVYGSQHNIISNNIKASEEGVYTNVIASYDGNVAPIVQADNDIRLDKQKTVVVEADIVGSFPGIDFWTSEDQATKYAQSSVRDYMKDMYKGHLLVIGDPTIKPHDAMYMNDTMVDMNGLMLVKAVTHHFSIETGFVSSIEPDAYVTNWDMDMLYHGKMASSIGKNIAILGASAGLTYVSKRVIMGSAFYRWMAEDENIMKAKYREISKKVGVRKMLNWSLKNRDLPVEIKDSIEELKNAKTNKEVKEAYQKVSDQLDAHKKTLKNAKKAGREAEELKRLETEIDQMKRVIQMAKNSNRIATGVKAGSAVFKTGLGLVKAIGMSNIITIALQVAFSVATEGLFEMWRRKKQNTQCVTIFPLQYRGSELVAGINGHQGAVYGDLPSKADLVYKSNFGDGNDDKTWYEYLSATLNFFSGDTGAAEEE